MGIQETKKIREIRETLDAKGLNSLRESSGNSSLNYELEVSEALDAEQIGVAGCNVQEFIDGFCLLCEDADYKAELVKIKTVILKLQKEVSRHTELHTYGEVTLQNSQLTICIDGENSLSNGSSQAVPQLLQTLY